MGTEKTGGGRAMRTDLLRLCRKPCEDASNPTYIFAEPRVGYRMAGGGTGAGGGVTARFAFSLTANPLSPLTIDGNGGQAQKKAPAGLPAARRSFFPLLERLSSRSWRAVAHGVGLGRDYRGRVNVNTKVLDFVQLGGPIRTELRTFRWEVQI